MWLQYSRERAYLISLILIRPWSFNFRRALPPLKVLRLFRLARALRLFAMFQELWMLVRGLIDSGFTLLHSFLILVIVHYIFACVAVELLTKHSLTGGDPEWDAIVDVYWKDLSMI